MKNHKEKIKDLKKNLKLTNAKIAEMFGYTSVHSYANSTKAKPKLERGLLKFYEHIEHLENKAKISL